MGNKKKVDNDAIKKLEVKEKEKEIVVGKVVNCNLLNVRNKPSKNSAVISLLNADEEVTININDSVGKWYRVLTKDGFEGYSMTDFIEIKKGE